MSDENKVLIKDTVPCYFTGVFDGEGCIHISNSNLSVEIGMTSKNILDKFQAYFGGKIYKNKKQKDKEHWKQSWQWLFTSNDSIPFLKMIQKYSIVKKTQIDMALDYQKIKFDGSKCGNEGISQSERDKREYYKDQLSELKKVEMTNIERNDYNKLCMANFDMSILNGSQKTLNFSDDDTNIYNEIDNDITETIHEDELYKENIKNLNVGYFSGFFDAEGSVGVYKTGNSYRLHTSIENTNYSVLQLFYEKYKIGKISIQKKRKGREHHKQSWLWQFKSNDTISFLQDIYPYTIEKREQIRLAIEFQDWKNKNIKHGVKLTQDQIIICDWYVKIIKDLKKEEDELIDDNENIKLNNIDVNQGILNFE